MNLAFWESAKDDRLITIITHFDDEAQNNYDHYEVLNIDHNYHNYLGSIMTGFRSSSIPYQAFEDEPGSTTEELKIEPTITFDCAYCEYRSPTQKGLLCHRITVHRIGVQMSRGSFHARSKYAVWTLTIMNYSGFPKSHISIYLHNILSGQRLFGLRVWSYQPLPEHIKCTYSAALQWLFGLQV
ncbi:uncharacterized protein TNIN_102291 [Trichonephila inaurata madagascariensis]|uniref:Uncharacterized protein n=1 Tax=Trichonephila inaurata madagascariensis TaxID=2747483 RepID=A0A8X6X2A4_9ARAC|nr:uncharacterized protein TNIN_102291 [Trichonephila inaurata madagascariensis]